MKQHPSLTLLVALATILTAGCNSTAPTPSTSSSTQTGSSSASASTDVTKTAGNVTVVFHAPDKFTDCRSTFGSSYDDHYLDVLAGEIQRNGGRYLEDGQKLAVDITDVDLAGDFNPSRSGLNDVRVIKEIYRPRIALSFKVTGADGTVVKQGDRTLADSYYMNNVLSVNRGDPLYYDTTMLNNWLRDEFKK